MGRVKLLELVRTNFNDEELRDICFHLSVDYDELPGDNKGAKARELITHLERRGRLVELIRLGEELRPQVGWPGTAAPIPSTQAPPALTPAEQSSLDTQINLMTRRLYKLQETQARKGINTEPEILIEIEDLEAKLAALRARRDGGR